VLTGQRLLRGLDQAHSQSTGHTNRLQTSQGIRIAINVLTQFCTLVADVLGIDEHSGNAGADHGRLERTDARDLQLIDQIPGGKHRTALLAVIRRIEEFQHDLGSRKGHAVQLEVAGFLHLAVGDRYMGDDGLADVGLPDPHHTGTVLRNALGIHQAGMQRERAGAG